MLNSAMGASLNNNNMSDSLTSTSVGGDSAVSSSSTFAGSTAEDSNNSLCDDILARYHPADIDLSLTIPKKQRLPWMSALGQAAHDAHFAAKQRNANSNKLLQVECSLDQIIEETRRIVLSSSPDQRLTISDRSSKQQQQQQQRARQISDHYHPVRRPTRGSLSAESHPYHGCSTGGSPIRTTAYAGIGRYSKQTGPTPTGNERRRKSAPHSLDEQHCSHCTCHRLDSTPSTSAPQSATPIIIQVQSAPGWAVPPEPQKPIQYNNNNNNNNSSYSVGVGGYPVLPTVFPYNTIMPQPVPGPPQYMASCHPSLNGYGNGTEMYLNEAASSFPQPAAVDTYKKKIHRRTAEPYAAEKYRPDHHQHETIDSDVEVTGIVRVRRRQQQPQPQREATTSRKNPSRGSGSSGGFFPRELIALDD